SAPVPAGGDAPGSGRGATVAAVESGTLKALIIEHLKVLAVRFARLAVLLGISVIILIRAAEPEGETASSRNLTQLPAPAASAPRPAQAGPAPAAKGAVVATPLETAEMQMRVLDMESGAPVPNAQLTLV